MTGRGRGAAVLGLGVSGYEAALLLAQEGRDVLCLDEACGGAIDERAAELRAAGVEVIVGARDVPARDIGLCVVSPGVSPDSLLGAGARDRGWPILGELEFGWSRLRGARTLAVTGSNGKSTCAKLCCEALRAAGCEAVVGGNYGTPLSRFAREGIRWDWVVAEVSSYQLETCRAFRPDVGILISLYPNHLDRHGAWETYVDMKARIFSRMGRADTAVVPAEWERRMRATSGGDACWVTFGRAGRGADAEVEARGGGIRGWGQRWEFGGTPFGEGVLTLTAAAAVGAMRGCGQDASCVEQAARVFERLPHRMQPVATVGGIRFVDDSKGTNLAALAAATESVGGPVRLIAGGLLKQHDLHSVKEVLARCVRGLYVIGHASGEMERAWGSDVSCRRCESIEEAVEAAWKDACAGETVLLSPGCASFDQFTGFAERGDRFAKAVRMLEGGGAR